MNVSMVISGIVLFFVLVGVLVGAIRGLKKSAVRVGVVVLSAVLAVWLSVSCANNILQTEIGNCSAEVNEFLGIDGVCQPSDTPLFEAVKNVMMANETLSDFMEVAPTLTAFIMVTPQVLIAESIFVFLFFIIKLVLGIPEMILKAIFMRKKEGEKGHHGWGALVGAVQGFFCACVVLVPLLGMTSLLGTAVEAAYALPDHEHGESADLIESIEVVDHEFLSPLTRDPAYRFLKATGIRYLCVETFYSLSNVTYNGERISYLREVNDLLPVALHFVEIGNIDYENMNEQDAAFLGDLVSSITHSHLASVTISEVVSNVSNKLLVGEEVLGITLPDDADESTSTFVHDVLEVLVAAEPESIPADLPNVVEAVEVLIIYGVFDDEAEIADMITNQLFTEDFLLALSHSTIMSPIAVSAVNDYGIGTFLGMLNTPSSNEDAYISMLEYIVSGFEKMDTDGIDYAALNENERAVYVHTISRLLEGFTQGLDTEDANMVATAILEAYATADALPTVENLMDLLNGMSIHALSSDHFETKMVLSQDVLIADKYLFNDMTEKERREEAAHLAATIADVFYLAETFADVESIGLGTLGPVGKFLDSMSATKLLESSLDNLLYLFVDTAYTLDALPDGAIELLRNKIHDHIINYENLFVNIASTFELANHIDVTGEVETTPEIEESFKQTIENLYATTDETTLEIAQSIVTEEFLVGMGVPEQGASVAQTVFNTFLEEVVKTKTDENTDFQAESKAIESVMTIVANVSSGEVTETINEELINAVIASETLTNTIISVSLKEEGALADHFDEEMLENASTVLNDYAAKVIETATPEEAEKINACLDALRAMIGLEIPV